MTYSAYERSVGTSVIRGVETYCRHLTNAGTFGAFGTPSLSDIERYIDQTYYQLQGVLAEAGYTVTVPASATAVLGILENLNTVGAVAKVELAHPITGRKGEPNDHYKQFIKMWEQGTAILASDALSNLGLVQTVELSSYIELGGASRSQKQGVYDDSDAVQSRFKRGMGRDPHVTAPISDQETAI